MTSPVIVVHGGAGDHTDELREHEADCHAALAEALNAGADALGGGGGAVEAVRAAVIVMESFPLFNAGHGSALCSDGSVELSAAVMRGSDRAAGGVAMITRTRHPVAAAVALLDEPEVLVAGASADAHAAAHGLEQCDPAEFVTDRQRRRLAKKHRGRRGDRRRGLPRRHRPARRRHLDRRPSGPAPGPRRRLAADRRRHLGRSPRRRVVHRTGRDVHPRRRGAAGGGARRARRDARSGGAGGDGGGRGVRRQRGPDRGRRPGKRRHSDVGCRDASRGMATPRGADDDRALTYAAAGE